MNEVSGEVSLSLILCGALKYKLQHRESSRQGNRPFAPLAATNPECMCVWGGGAVCGGGMKTAWQLSRPKGKPWIKLQV